MQLFCDQREQKYLAFFSANFKGEEPFACSVKRAEFDTLGAEGKRQFYQPLMVGVCPVDLFTVGKNDETFDDGFRRR